MTVKKKLILTVIITAIVSCTLTIAVKDGLFLLRSFKDKDAAFSLKLQNVDDMLDKFYLYDYNSNKDEMRENAIKAYVEGLNEPYTHYYTSEEFSSYMNNIQDGYVGIGIVVGVNENNLIEVISPVEDSPAYEAGVASGDILKSVDGVEYTGDKMTDAINVIKGGKEGTTVDLMLIRNNEEIKITVERRDISSDSVKVKMLEDNIGYMRISGFNMESTNGEHSTYSEFKDKLSELKSNGMQKLIIDLRDNPGGVLTEVCEIADDLLPEGVITYIEDKNGKRKYYNSDANSEVEGIPIVVLINEGSASASEVLTGALKDYGRAVIVGNKSYGKGIVQNIYPFTDGSGISLTSAKYYTPNGICIHEKGIEPDVQVDLDEEYKDLYASMLEFEQDAQLQKALEIIREK